MMLTSQNAFVNGQSRQRRPHRKSRNGCRACKARRTKCDEQGPPCVNCIIRKTECIYDASSTSGKAATSAIASSPTEATATASAVRYGIQPRNRSELELLFQWISFTAPTIASSYVGAENWSVDITRDALKFEPLLDALFAMAAAHMADELSSSDPARDRLLTRSLEYYGRCCETFRIEVTNITDDRSKAILHCSIALMILRLHVPHYEDENKSYITRILAVFEMLQGTWSIAKAIDDGKSGPLQPDLIVRLHEPRSLDDSDSAAFTRLYTICRKIIFHDNPTHNTEGMESCIEAINKLEAWWVRSKNHNTVLAWLLAVPRGFISFIEEGNTVAQLILMYWAVLFQRICGDHRWWSRSVGRSLVHELCRNLDESARQDSNWSDALLWATEQVT